ncbi:hypothetical protein COZ14_02410 [Candidatus Dojkabacteria bacterium CG_4_10_14_3_um_filter_Dojkabacteria_WS6_41_9]|nr:MAG: hypothetical protein COZ14_02410 [Candidatus Dojkabacteria bacterium CG_4_10_14_3_um_filter_Dojkabacteria_WS6_41_9]
MVTDLAQSPINHATQDILEVADILNDLLVTKNGTVCLILKTSSVNFDLLSEDEQDVKIASFGSMVNSLDFQLQILIETRKINISKYADYLDTMDTPDLSAGLKRQFVIYKQFIRNLITNKEILDKRFMIIIPYRTGSVLDKNSSIEEKKKVIESATNYLYPKKYHIIKMVKGMGLDATQMTSSDISKYLYSIFNPGLPIKIDELAQIYT